MSFPSPIISIEPTISDLKGLFLKKKRRLTKRSDFKNLCVKIFGCSKVSWELSRTFYSMKLKNQIQKYGVKIPPETFSKAVDREVKRKETIEEHAGTKRIRRSFN